MRWKCRKTWDNLPHFDWLTIFGMVGHDLAPTTKKQMKAETAGVRRAGVTPPHEALKLALCTPLPADDEPPLTAPEPLNA